MNHKAIRHTTRPRYQQRTNSLPVSSNPVLPQPSFNHGSLSHSILLFAREIDKAFTIENVKRFLRGEKTPYEISRALEVLVKNKSIEKLNSTYWTITRTGLYQLNDMSIRRMQKLSSEKK
jgi:hypothetical protein